MTLDDTNEELEEEFNTFNAHDIDSRQDDIENNIIRKLETVIIVKLNKTIRKIHYRINKNDSNIKKMHIEFKVLAKYIVIIYVISTVLFIYLFVNLYSRHG